MKITHLPDQGYMADGHGLDPLDLTDHAERAHLEAGRELPTHYQASIAEAWWGGDEIGFCQKHHDGAQPVTVVHIPGA